MSVRADHPAADESGRRPDLDHQLLMLYRMSRSAGWTAFFTLVIAAGIAACAYLFWQQLTVLQDQLDQMQELSGKVEKSLETSTAQSAAAVQAMQALSEQVGRTAEAAQQAAAAADRSREAGKAAERPWVGIDSVSVAPFRPNQSAPIRATIRNSGRSPALNVRMTLKAVAIAAKSVAIPELDECPDCAQSVLLPNGGSMVEAVIDGSVLSNEKINSLKNGDDTILLSGRIDYTDGADARHTTTICMLYMPAMSGFGACMRGNRLD